MRHRRQLTEGHQERTRMKSLTVKKGKSKDRGAGEKRDKVQPDERKAAQCCAKTSKTVAGCRD